MWRTMQHVADMSDARAQYKEAEQDIRNDTCDMDKVMFSVTFELNKCSHFTLQRAVQKWRLYRYMKNGLNLFDTF